MRLLSAGSNPEFSELLKQALPRGGDVMIQSWPGSVTAIGTVEAMAARRPDVIVLGPAVDPATAFAVAARLEKAAPSITVVVVAPPGPSTWQAAVESGVRSVIDPIGTIEDLREGLRSALEASRGRRRDDHRGSAHKVIVIASPKGGVGKTMLTANTAVALAVLSKKPVAVIDLDLEFGDISHQLMLTPEYSLADAADELPDLDLTTLKVFLTMHPAGISCLTAPDDASKAGEISPEASAAIVDLIASEFPYVLVDTAGGLDDHALAVMEHATDLILLSDMDVPSVRNVRKAVQLLDLLGIGDAHRHFVLNRADSRVGLQVPEVASAVGLPVDVEIPSSRQVPLSVNEGRPIVMSRPRSPVSRRIGALAQRLLGDPEERGGST